MKNSLKFFAAAGLLLLGSLTAYNAALHTEYVRGSYKDPLHNYNSLALRDFNTLAVPSAGAMQMRVEAGPYGVFVSKDAAQYVRITQQGAGLTVALAFPEKEAYLGTGDVVIIRCPRLSALTAGTAYTVAGQSKTTAKLDHSNSKQLLVQGFAQDSLRLSQDHTAHVVLAGNHLSRLLAVVGGTPGSTAQLDLSSTNRIDTSDLRVEEHGKLMATNLALPARHWHFSDSARVELSGRALEGLR
jgi:hypothetical protein